jgi:hypothetical protein
MPRRGRALVPGAGGSASSGASGFAAASSVPRGAEDPPPFPQYAHSPQDVEERQREAARHSRQEAAVHASAREAAAPFATEASMASLEAQIAEREAQLLAHNQQRAAIDTELKALAGGPRTIASMRRKEVLESDAVACDRVLSEVRRWLKANVD